jgi:CRISPR/Cas system endoribonuclease Cas6 (RAMP superfamily)
MNKLISSYPQKTISQTSFWSEDGDNKTARVFYRRLRNNTMPKFECIHNNQTIKSQVEILLIKHYDNNDKERRPGETQHTYEQLLKFEAMWNFLANFFV